MVSVDADHKCWPWKGNLDKNGYGVYGKQGAHRAAWEIANREALVKGDVVMHICDNPECCNPLHLKKGTHITNMQDRNFKLRTAAGMQNGRSKLTNEQVIAILFDTSPKRQIAKKYGIDESTVRGIKTGKTWGWLTCLYSKL